MKSIASFPGTKQHQALLNRIVASYQNDPRILAVIVFGSLGRGNWDEYSDLDLDVVVADDIRIDISNELQKLCQSFAGLNERAAIIIPDGDEGGYHPGIVVAAFDPVSLVIPDQPEHR